MAQEQTDHLGREMGTSTSAQTVTEFAVEQGTLDADAPGVQETLEEDKRRAEEGAERARTVSERMAPDSPEEQEEQEEQSPPVSSGPRAGDDRNL